MVKEQLNVLPPNYELHWYRIERELGQGGFGITYLAQDTNLEQLVAIKEYLPVEFAVRAPDSTVQPRSEAHQDRYRWGLERFINEAQTLAKFDHPSIVRVYSVFEYNNTAYMVMRYERGENLETVLERRKTLEEGELMKILLPILDGLEQVHRSAFIHRDIKPDNVYIRQDGTPVLLDFGSARQALGNDRTLTILVAPGYAPFEQYGNSSDQQGPWTDIYSLGATLYRAVAGAPPVDAMARSKGILGSTRDVLVRAADIGRGRYSPKFLEAIDHALAFNERDRPQTIAEWKTELRAQIQTTAPDAPVEVTAESDNAGSAGTPKSGAREAAPISESPATGAARPYEAEFAANTAVYKERSDQPRPKSRSPWFRAAVTVALLVLLSLVGIFVLRTIGEQPGETPPPEATTQKRPAETDRLVRLERELAAREKKIQDERRRLDEERKRLKGQVSAKDALAVREQNLLEERKRLEEEKQRLAEQERDAAEKRQKAATAKRRAEEEARRVAEAARQREETISRILAAAETDLAAGRLSTPVGGNALERFQKVLEIEARNTKARQGIERVVDGYIGFADRAMRRHEFGKAQGYLDKAAAIGAAGERVARARAHLASEKKAFDRQQQVAAARRKEAEKSTRVAAMAPASPAASPTLEEQLTRAIAAFDARNYSEAFRKLKPLADQDVAAASYRVGVMYDTGRGAPRSDDEAAKWYRKAAEQGYAAAQNSLGVMYATGRGVARDDRTALHWYRRAAEQCNADAQTNVGRMYAQGRGVMQSDFQAYAWYNVAAEAGNVIARDHREAIAKKLQPLEIEHARKLSRRYARECKKA
ncbi:MAG: protein kinase [Acidiferrobacterales bacterium]